MRVSGKQLGFAFTLIVAGFSAEIAWSQQQDKEKIVAERQELMSSRAGSWSRSEIFFRAKVSRLRPSPA